MSTSAASVPPRRRTADDVVPEQAYDVYPEIEEEFSAALDQSLTPARPGSCSFDLVARLGLAVGRRGPRRGLRRGQAGRGPAPAVRIPRHRHRPGAPGISSWPGPPRPGRSGLRGRHGREHPGWPGHRWTWSGAATSWCTSPTCRARTPNSAACSGRVVTCSSTRCSDPSCWSPREAAWLWATMGVVPENANPARTEAAVAAPRDCGSTSSWRSAREWSEWAEERRGAPAGKLLHDAPVHGSEPATCRPRALRAGPPRLHARRRDDCGRAAQRGHPRRPASSGPGNRSW